MLTITILVSSCITTMLLSLCLAVCMKMRIKLSNTMILLVGGVIFFKVLLCIELPYTITVGSERYFDIINLIRSREGVVEGMLTIWVVVAIVLEAAFLYEHILAFKYVHRFKANAIAYTTTTNRDRQLIYYIIKSPMVKTPSVFGIFTTVVLLPEYLDPKQVEYVLLHEEAHITSRDCLIAFIMEQISIIFWWNVALLPLKRFIYDTQEMRADEIAVTALSLEERFEYAETMIAVSKMQVEKCGLGFIYRKLCLKARIMQVLDENVRFAKASLWQYLIAMMILAGAFMFVLEPKVPEEKLKDDVQFTEDGSLPTSEVIVDEIDGKYYLISNDTVLKEITLNEYKSLWELQR